MTNRFMLLGLVVLASSFCSVGQTQSMPVPGVALDHVKPQDSTSNVDARYCTYDWGVSFNCRELFAYSDQTGNYISLSQNRLIGFPYSYGVRGLTCRVKPDAWRATRNSADIPAIALDTSSPECETGGFLTRCGESGCETTDWVYYDTITIEGSWSNPETISRTKRTEDIMDNLNGVKSHVVCNEDISSRFMVGGWSFLAQYYPVGDWYSEEGNPTVSGTAERIDRKCTITGVP